MITAINVNLIGSFVFVHQGYGILSIIYNNYVETDPYPETAKRISDSDKNPGIVDLFDGLYKTVWLEKEGIDNTDLEIIRQENGSYKLEWRSATQKKLYYTGIGFLHNNDLIGAYWQR